MAYTVRSGRDSEDFLLSPVEIEIWLGRGDPFLFQVGAEYQLLDGTTEEIRILDQGSHWRISKKSPGLACLEKGQDQVCLRPELDKADMQVYKDEINNRIDQDCDGE